MPENIHICPFSRQSCRSCALYRGRHGYITCKDADETPESRIVKRVEIDWQDRFKEVLRNREEYAPAAEETSTTDPAAANERPKGTVNR